MKEAPRGCGVWPSWGEESVPPSSVPAFFDRVAADYKGAGRGANAGFHRRTARQLEDALHGRVLAVGGLWAEAGSERLPEELFVADASIEMLVRALPLAATGVIADARQLPIADQMFEHVVYPLVLHHLVGDDAPGCQRAVTKALHEAFRVLRPGGRVWISDFSIPEALYPWEQMAAPLTRRLLGAFRIPLVLMHPASFYLRSLREVGFEDACVTAIPKGGERPWDPVRPVIGLPWLVVPRGAYPIRPVLIHARRPLGTEGA